MLGYVTMPRWIDYIVLSLFAQNLILIKCESSEQKHKLVYWINNNLQGFLLIEYESDTYDDISKEVSILELYLISSKQVTKFLLVQKGNVNILRQKYPFIPGNKRHKKD